jgi:hypothetical protein
VVEERSRVNLHRLCRVESPSSEVCKRMLEPSATRRSCSLRIALRVDRLSGRLGKSDGRWVSVVKHGLTCHGCGRGQEGWEFVNDQLRSPFCFCICPSQHEAAGRASRATEWVGPCFCLACWRSACGGKLIRNSVCGAAGATAKDKTLRAQSRLQLQLHEDALSQLPQT